MCDPMAESSRRLVAGPIAGFRVLISMGKMSNKTAQCRTFPCAFFFPLLFFIFFFYPFVDYFTLVHYRT